MKKSKTQDMTKLALLTAIELLLVITPLGFLPIPGLAITLVHIPVLVGAIVLGVRPGVFLGLIYGISSVITATVRGDIGSIIFTPVHSGSWLSLILAIVPRILFPIAAALLFQILMKKGVNDRLSAGIAAAVGSLVNTVLVLGLIYLFFGQMYAELNKVAYSALLGILITAGATNGVLEAAVGAVVCMALVRPLRRVTE